MEISPSLWNARDTTFTIFAQLPSPASIVRLRIICKLFKKMIDDFEPVWETICRFQLGINLTSKYSWKQLFDNWRCGNSKDFYYKRIQPCIPIENFMRIELVVFEKQFLEICCAQQLIPTGNGRGLPITKWLKEKEKFLEETPKKGKTDLNVKVANLFSGVIIKTQLEEDQKGVTAFAVCRLYIVTADREFSIRVFNRTTGIRLYTIHKTHAFWNHYIRALACNNQYMISVVLGGETKIWNIETGELIVMFRSCVTYATDLFLRKNSLIQCGFNGRNEPSGVYVMNLDKISFAHEIICKPWKDSNEVIQQDYLNLHRRSAIAYNDRHLVGVTRKGVVKIWKIDDPSREPLEMIIPRKNEGCIFDKSWPCIAIDQSFIIVSLTIQSSKDDHYTLLTGMDIYSGRVFFQKHLHFDVWKLFKIDNQIFAYSKTDLLVMDFSHTFSELNSAVVVPIPPPEKSSL